MAMLLLLLLLQPAGPCNKSRSTPKKRHNLPEKINKRHLLANAKKGG
jgi:hypothetical protein